MPGKKSQTTADRAADSQKKGESSSESLRECDEVQITARGRDIVITAYSETEMELQITVNIEGICQTRGRCFWDGQRWVCTS